MSEVLSVDLVEQVKVQALEELESASDDDALEQWRVEYLGRSGRITQLLRGLGALEPDDRRTVGAAANSAKGVLSEGLDLKTTALKGALLAGRLDTESIDVTLPGRPAPQGRLHPITQTRREIEEAFVAMGFEVREGPEVEWDHYNFDMLNIPKDHPARDMWDTMWVDTENEDGERS
ncbi:MAG: phenylalanine--tRNA ligase subunit alpha, partial [Proteobacteria bacterium]|nr:phenylalanine--tRNA ligase subunit alpha [Pseudomonadota bacterium]